MTTAAESSITRSQTSAIFKLPDDVLSLVFLLDERWRSDHGYDADDGTCDYQEMKDHALFTSLKRARTLASVCHHWREVALNMAQLWTYISADKPKYAAELVMRSREAPLSVFCTIPTQPPEAFWSGFSELLSQCMGRMRNLRMVLQTHADDERFWSLLCRPQALRRLAVTGSGHPDGGVPPSLSKNIPLDKMSSLRFLYLHAICLQEHLPPIPTLRRFAVLDSNVEHISLSNDHVRNANLSVAWLLRSLRNIPNIEIFEAAAVSVGPLPFDQRPRVFKLPKLKLMKLVCTDVASSMIFEFFEVPRVAEVNIIFGYKPPSRLNTDGMTSLLSRYQRHPTAELCLSIRADIGNGGDGQLAALLLSEDELVCPTLVVTNFWRDLLHEHTSLLPLDRLCTLEYISDDEPGSVEKWVEMTAMCPNLRKLGLKRTAGITFLREYTQRYLWSHDSKTANVNPYLSHLGFNMVNFGAGVETTVELDTLVESLGEMKRAGLSLDPGS